MVRLLASPQAVSPGWRARQTPGVAVIGDHPATFLLGKIYSNMAGVCFHLKRPHEGISYLEKAVDYYEHSDHQMMAAIATVAATLLRLALTRLL